MVTGVAQPLVTRLARRLARQPGMSVIGVDTTEPTRLGEADFLRAELTNPIVVATLRDRQVDTLVHAGIHATPRASGGRRHMKEHNVIGSLQLLAGAHQAQSLRQVVLKSSTAVYGASADAPTLLREEDADPRRVTGFGRDLLDIEGYAAGLARRRADITLTTFRFANFVGGTDDSALAGFFALPLLPSVLGWDPRLQFCHADDAVALMASTVDEPRSGTFNVAGAGAIHLSQATRRAGRFHVPIPGVLVEMVAAMLIRSGRVDVPADQLSFLRFGRVVDTTALVEQFGFRPHHTTSEAFAAFLARRNDHGVSRRDLLALIDELREWLAPGPVEAA